MTARNTTLSVAGVLLALLLTVAFWLPVPYVTEEPGLTADTLGYDISASGRTTSTPVISFGPQVKTYPTTGELRMTTVSVTNPASRVSLLQAFGAWFNPKAALLPRDVVYPPDQSVQQAEQQTQVEMTGSQSTAKVAGLTEAGYRVKSYPQVAAVVTGSPADGQLQPGDHLVSIDGAPVTSSAAAVRAVQAKAPGEVISFDLLRGGKRTTATVTAGSSTTSPGSAMVGISLADGYSLPFPVSFHLARNIGGPSAGTMFALAIYDKLTAGDLTGGQVVAGTGAIGYDGAVGAIGGIQQKIVSAQDDGAAIFLVPATNCGEAVGADVNFDAIRLVKISTLDDAVSSLKTLARDPSAAVPTCP